MKELQPDGNRQREQEGKDMISTRGRYALRVMIDLAEHEDGHPVSMSKIAERQEISRKYLEIIGKDLVTAGMIRGISGKGGGYLLCRKPSEYTVGEIIETMEGTLAPVACLECGAKKCLREENCKTLPMWKDFHTMIHDFFYSKTLSDLIG